MKTKYFCVHIFNGGNVQTAAVKENLKAEKHFNKLSLI